MKAIAAVAYTPGGADHLVIEEVEVAPPKAHEVRLKVLILMFNPLRIIDENLLILHSALSRFTKYEYTRISIYTYYS